MLTLDFRNTGIDCHDTYMGFPSSSDGKRICLQCRKPGFNPWVGKIHIHVQSLVMFFCVVFFFFLNTRVIMLYISFYLLLLSLGVL